MRRLLMILAAAALVTAGLVRAGEPGGQGPPPTVAPVAGEQAVSDRQLGLRKTDLKDDQAPRPVVYPGDVPGGNALLPRNYPGAPPLIPHSLDGLVPITREDNMCLVCHATSRTDPVDPTPVPESHLRDLRHAPGVVRESVAGARWVCTSCHVPQSDAPALVGSTFRSGR